MGITDHGRASLCRAPLVALVLAVFGNLASAAEQRSCLFQLAVFPTAAPEPVDFRMILAAVESAARVRVEGSGEWSGRRVRNNIGADTVTFDTTAARETVTIGVNGEALWQIDYFDPAVGSERVIAFAGQCQPWRVQ